MNSATDSGLVEHVISSWCAHYKEEKQALEFQMMLDGQNAKFGAFNDRNKKGAQTAGQKATEIQQYGLINHAFILWNEASKVERLLRYYQQRVEAKKGQLQGLQSMFRTFANQLETGLKDGTPRDGHKPKKLTKSDNTVSLPNIHKTPTGSHRSH